MNNTGTMRISQPPDSVSHSIGQYHLNSSPRITSYPSNNKPYSSPKYKHPAIEAIILTALALKVDALICEYDRWRVEYD